MSKKMVFDWNKEEISWLGKNCKDCGNEKCKKLDKLPKGFDCALWQAKSEECEEIKLGDEVASDHGTKGVVVGIDTWNGEVLLSLLMRNYNVPQLVLASAYKTKTGRHFPQIIEVLKQIKGDQGMNVTEIINVIHQQGVENDVFVLLSQWMIEDRRNKMKRISESETIIQAINKIATKNKNLEQAIDGIISLSGSEDKEDV